VPQCYRHPGREARIRCQRCERPICPECMNDAAVGFQCPSCIAEGRKTTRSARTAYGGIRSTNPGATTIALISINAAVWLAILLTGGAGSELVRVLSVVPDGLCWAGDGGAYYPGAGEQVCRSISGAEWADGVSQGAYWQLLTNMFAHVQVWHIGFNMLALWVLGPQLEMVVGRARFLALYLLSGLAGSAVVYWISDERSATLGASGAIFGLMGALLVIAIKVGGNVQSVLTWIGINFVITIVGSSFISWQGHLGGFLGGALIASALVFAPRARRTAFQVSMLVAIGCAIAVAVIARTAVLA
jgi:membrane associated rhomboid family serine protease